MDPQRHERIKRLFLAACELEPDARNAFLEQACDGDAELRSEVESLLAHHRPTTIIETPQQPTTRRQQPPAGSPTGSQSGLDSSRFAAGTLVAGRYRIVGQLGRGGMGEVYRADDLTMGQSVALKFLPPELALNPRWLERLRSEVRLARRVTDAHVCRVHDLVEHEGESFITMEYVDGEDLASLLRRIGRLPPDKALQLARQMCQGLAAAHDQGVLHRDLKPANIMIDGRGQVRITDFGIAALAEEGVEGGPRAGTPAYMAPEVLAGHAATARSDVYALGLVIYEMITGKPAFKAATPTEYARLHQETTPRSPAEVVGDLDPAISRAVMACLAKDPAQRPASAHAVAAALPGADPLAAAVAAGLTPSPAMVAAAGTREGLSLAAGAKLLTAAVAMVILAMVMVNHAMFVPRTGLPHEPTVLADRARQALQALGHGQPYGDRVWGFGVDGQGIRHLAEVGEGKADWAVLETGRPPVVYFWYREGARPMFAGRADRRPTLADPAPLEPGMKSVRLDAHGRLIGFLAVSERRLPESEPDVEPDWRTAFELAGLDYSHFAANPVPPQRRPLLYAEQLQTWEGHYPGRPDMPVRVEGAALGGQILFFEVNEPWNLEVTRPVATRGVVEQTRSMLGAIMFILMLGGGGLLAWRNVRLGRGDRRGAWKLLGFLLAMFILRWAFEARHVGGAGGIVYSLRTALAQGLMWSTITAVYYLALEPYVRRLWPHSIVTWSRLLTGQWRDPGIGRDLLIGAILGMAIVLILQLEVLVPAWLGLSNPPPRLPFGVDRLDGLLGPRLSLAQFVQAVTTGIWVPMMLLLLLLLLRVLLRVPWLAAGVFCVVGTLWFAPGDPPAGTAPWVGIGLMMVLIGTAFLKLGLLPVMVGVFLTVLWINTPITTDPGAWYAGATIFFLLVVLMLLGLGFHTSLAGRPILGRALVDA